MIERTGGAPEGLKPAMEAVLASSGRIRLVYELGDEFTGYTGRAAWEDMKLVGDLSKFERCAVVTDHRLLADAVRAFGLLMPGKVVVSLSERAQALTWSAD